MTGQELAKRLTEVPQDLDNEKCLLASLIHGPGLCLEHAAVLTESLFCASAHISIFQAIVSLAKTHDEIEFPMLVSEVSKFTSIGEVGGREFLVYLWDLVQVPSNWQYYYEEVFKAYRRRQAFLAVRKIIECDDPDEQAEIADKALKKIAAPQNTQSIEFKDRLRETLDWLEQSATCRPKSLVKFGIPKLDMQLYPIEPGNQVVICAKMGGGKSALAGQAVLKADDGACAIFSLEMPSNSLIIRMLSSHTDIPMRWLRSAELSEQQLTKLGSSVSSLGPRKIWIEDTRPADIKSIEAKCRALKHQGLTIAVIDYLQLVSPVASKRDVSREREVAEISRRLKSLAMELQICTIALSQLNDHGELRESRSIGQDADLVLRVNLDDENAENSEIEIVKQRNGGKGKVPIRFDGKVMRFSEV